MVKEIKLFSLLVFVMILLSACGELKEESQPTLLVPTDVQSIFNDQCVGCHSGSSPAGSLNLSVGNAYTQLINVTSTIEPTLKRVVPSDTANSYLVDKIMGTQTVGERMPDGGPYLSAAQMNIIKVWIQTGAEARP